jgi:hypothetical protein
MDREHTDRRRQRVQIPASALSGGLIQHGQSRDALVHLLRNTRNPSACLPPDPQTVVFGTRRNSWHSFTVTSSCDLLALPFRFRLLPSL